MTFWKLGKTLICDDFFLNFVRFVLFLFDFDDENFVVFALGERFIFFRADEHIDECGRCRVVPDDDEAFAATVLVSAVDLAQPVRARHVPSQVPVVARDLFRDRRKLRHQ